MVLFYAAIQIVGAIVSLLFQALFMRTFGVKFETDAYYISLVVVQFISNLVSGFFTTVFIPIYNELSLQEKREQDTFAAAVLLVAFTTGVLVTIITSVGSLLLVARFARGLAPETLIYAGRLLSIQGLSIPFVLTTGVLNALLNAHMRIAITFIGNLAPTICNIASLLLLGTIEAVVGSTVIGQTATCCFLLIYASSTVGISLAHLAGQTKNILCLLGYNAGMRVGGLTYQLAVPITYNFISHFPPGSVTIFAYSVRILEFMYNAIGSSLNQPFYAKAAHLLTRKKNRELDLLTTATARSGAIGFTICMLGVASMLGVVLRVLFSEKLSSLDLEWLRATVLLLSPLYVILAVEQPFGHIINTRKDWMAFMQYSILYIVLQYGALWMALRGGVFALVAVAISVVRLVNVVLYMRWARAGVGLTTEEPARNLVCCLMTIGALAVSNIYCAGCSVYIIPVLNAVIASLLLYWMRDEVSKAVAFIVRRDDL